MGQETCIHQKAETYIDEPGTYFLKVNTKIAEPKAFSYELKYQMHNRI